MKPPAYIDTTIQLTEVTCHTVVAQIAAVPHTLYPHAQTRAYVLVFLHFAEPKGHRVPSPG